MSNVQFISIEDFKAQTNVKSFSVKRNPKTQKLFVALDNGSTMRCQQEFDAKKPIIFIADKDTPILDACLTNYDDTKGAETIASF